MREFRELAVSAGADPVAVLTGTRKTPDPRLFVGSGKADAPGPDADALESAGFETQRGYGDMPTVFL